VGIKENSEACRLTSVDCNLIDMPYRPYFTHATVMPSFCAIINFFAVMDTLKYSLPDMTISLF